MDIEKLARKLEPIIPSQVKQWLKIRDTAGQDLRELIDQRIIQEGYKAFGEWKGKILLSLPPKKLCPGDLHLGTIFYGEKKWPFCLLYHEMLQNMCIFGRSGAGKTNLVFHIIEQLSQQGIPFLFLDWKRTGRHLLPRLKEHVNIYTPGRSLAPFPFNPFIPPPGEEPTVFAHHVTDVLGDAYSLGDGAKSLIQKALSDKYRQGNVSPNIESLTQAVGALDAKERARGWQISALRALESLGSAFAMRDEGMTQEELAKSLLTQTTFLELDGLSNTAKKFIIPLLCSWIYHVKRGDKDREKLKLVIIIEEAHHILYSSNNSRETLMEQLLRQCREFGIAMIVVDQHPSLISQAALGNSYTTVCLNLKDPTDINKAAKLSLLDEDDKRFLNMLPVGSCIVKLQDRWRRPFLLAIPLLEVPKGAISDKMLSEYSRGYGLSLRMTPGDGNSQGLADSRISDIISDAGAIALIQDIVAFPDDGVDKRYKRLGFSVDKGNRLKKALLNAGIAEGQRVKTSQTERLLLRLSSDVRSLIGQGEVTRESLAHEYWKRYYAKLFREKGYQVGFEVRRQRGRVDLLAVKAAENGSREPESVAIEIETGKSDVVWNVKQDLLMGWRVLVVATDQEALRRVERELGTVGLLGVARVALVKCGATESGAFLAE